MMLDRASTKLCKFCNWLASKLERSKVEDERLNARIRTENRRRFKKRLENLHEYVYIVKFMLQMGIGAVVMCYLVGDFWLAFKPFESSHNAGALNEQLVHSLQTVAYGLGISAGIEMAYMLFTPGPDEAVEPVILSLAAAILYGLSVINYKDNENFIGFSLLIGTLVASIAVLFYVKERFVNKDE